MRVTAKEKSKIANDYQQLRNIKLPDIDHPILLQEPWRDYWGYSNFFPFLAVCKHYSQLVSISQYSVFPNNKISVLVTKINLTFYYRNTMHHFVQRT